MPPPSGVCVQASSADRSGRTKTPHERRRVFPLCKDAITSHRNDDDDVFFTHNLTSIGRTNRPTRVHPLHDRTRSPRPAPPKRRTPS
ncbi:hypothetical protein FM119_10030 [Mycetocola reblochoni REB411]|uniref:Uncharacterized protein n=1 Tax=Mycetocola reblochoni REB411 TaxID=1255698 RepID=A0A1R4JXM2_9MICO|nr:hypothetical protein FM119_10030 [Mycetocola reblochoni REB411]